MGYSLIGGLTEGLLFGIAVLGALVALRVLDYPDLTFDGSLVLGGAVSSTLLVLGWSGESTVVVALLAGAVAGACTALLHVAVGVSRLLSGIITAAVLYSMNIVIMGGANISLLRHENALVFSDGVLRTAGVSVVAVGAAAAGLVMFFRSRRGLVLRGLGMNWELTQGLGYSSTRNLVLGLMIANALVAVSGALLAQQHRYIDVSDGIGGFVVALSGLVVGETIVRPKSIALALVAAVVGSVLLTLLFWAALRMGFPAQYYKLLSALLIVLAIAIRIRSSWDSPFRSTW